MPRFSRGADSNGSYGRKRNQSLFEHLSSPPCAGVNHSRFLEFTPRTPIEPAFLSLG
jgi:hypothetical protein